MNMDARKTRSNRVTYYSHISQKVLYASFYFRMLELGATPDARPPMPTYLDRLANGGPRSSSRGAVMRNRSCLIETCWRIGGQLTLPLQPDSILNLGLSSCVNARQ